MTKSKKHSTGRRPDGNPVKKPLKICFVSSELTPLAKTGGLADVSTALSAFLHTEGHDVRVVLPRYGRIRDTDLDIEPVSGLSELTVRAGHQTIAYSIERAELAPSATPVYLVHCPRLYHRESLYTQDADEHLRFLLLCRAALEMCQRQGFSPDIVHCNDWQSGPVPLYLKTTYAWDRLFERTKSVLTIHNIGYQGMFPAATVGDLELGDAEHHLHQDDLRSGVINFLKTGILYADLVTTVSPTYAREILGPEYGMGLDGLLRERQSSVVGVLNGVDYGEWDPAKDELLPAKYSTRNMRGKQVCKETLLREMGMETNLDRPLIGFVSRLAGQKGIDLIEQVLPRLLSARDFAFVALGSGESRYEAFFEWLQGAFPGRASFYRGFNNKLAHWIEAGSDMFLMPSRYEPCGLNQMYSLKYGTVPIVRETGGLADSVEQIDPKAGTGTGVLFRDYDNNGLAWALNTALDSYDRKTLWKRVRRNGMNKDFSWGTQAAQYVDLYRALLR